MKSQRLIVQMGMTLVFTVITIVAVEAYVTDELVSYYTLDKNDIAGGTVERCRWRQRRKNHRSAENRGRSSR